MIKECADCAGIVIDFVYSRVFLVEDTFDRKSISNVPEDLAHYKKFYKSITYNAYLKVFIFKPVGRDVVFYEFIANISE
jgi:hypothetical protein